jgi:molybdopterin converting factor small subunit
VSTPPLSITVRFIGSGLRAIAGTGETKILVPCGTHLDGLMTLLAQELLQAQKLIDPQTGALHRQYRLLLNGRFVEAGASGEKPLEDGDCVSLLPAVFGG